MDCPEQGIAERRTGGLSLKGATVAATRNTRAGSHALRARREFATSMSDGAVTIAELTALH
jgi:hypothetical protein